MPKISADDLRDGNAENARLLAGRAQSRAVEREGNLSGWRVILISVLLAVSMVFNGWRLMEERETQATCERHEAR
jgi:hypothetical protein